MKIKILILTIATLFGIQTLSAQSVEKQITAIRAEVTAINKNAKNYKKTTKDVEGVSLEGTEATYFVSGKGLRKITAKMYGETYNATLELYYQGEDLIFAYQKLNKYNGTITMKNLKVIKVEESRLYFAGAKMIRYLFGKKQIKADSTEFNEEEYRMIELSDMFKAAYSK
jgi:hypothetical protein